MVLLQGGRILDPLSGRDEEADLLLGEGRIQGIGTFDPHREWDRVYDVRGKIVAPGFIDVHVHFRDPGFTYKEDIHTGAAAAARGGYTTGVCMANTNPPMDDPRLLEEFLRRASGEKVRIHGVGAVTKGLQGEELTDMEGLRTAGALGFSDDGRAIRDAGLLRRAMKEARGLPLSLHEEDGSLIGDPGIPGGWVAAALGFRGAPWESEASLVARDCVLAAAAGGRLHFQHISSAASLDCLRQGLKAGAALSAEVTPHHFSLTEEALLTQGTLAKVNPPLRTEEDRQALISALKEGLVGIIATDHAPHSREEKHRSLREAPSGMIGLETSLALGITHLVLPGHLSLGELVRRMSTEPAALYGLEGGSLREGGPGDIVVFDDQAEWRVGDFASKSANSPFIGRTLRGQVCLTFCRGQVVYPE